MLEAQANHSLQAKVNTLVICSTLQDNKMPLARVKARVASVPIQRRSICISAFSTMSSSILQPTAWSLLPILQDIWGSILRAVPKKKTPYSKKRSRFLSGKALQDVRALNRCSACGNIKKAHLLCPFCVFGKSLQSTSDYETVLLLLCRHIHDEQVQAK